MRLEEKSTMADDKGGTGGTRPEDGRSKEPNSETETRERADKDTVDNAGNDNTEIKRKPGRPKKPKGEEKQNEQKKLTEIWHQEPGNKENSEQKNEQKQSSENETKRVENSEGGKNQQTEEDTEERAKADKTTIEISKHNSPEKKENDGNKNEKAETEINKEKETEIFGGSKITIRTPQKNTENNNVFENKNDKEEKQTETKTDDKNYENENGKLNLAKGQVQTEKKWEDRIEEIKEVIKHEIKHNMNSLTTENDMKNKIIALEKEIRRLEKENDTYKEEMRKNDEIIIELQKDLNKAEERIDESTEKLRKEKILLREKEITIFEQTEREKLLMAEIKRIEGKLQQNKQYERKEKNDMISFNDDNNNDKQSTTENAGENDKNLTRPGADNAKDIKEKEQVKRKSPRKLSDEEWEKEKEMRREKRKNVIVKGLTLISDQKEEELEKWIWNETDVRIRIEKMRRVEKGWKIKITELEKKIELMRNKTRIDQNRWGVWISDDYTERQKEIQQWMEEEAKAWEKKGKTVRVEYLKICVDGTWLFWDEKDGDIVQANRTDGNKEEKQRFREYKERRKFSE